MADFTRSLQRFACAGISLNAPDDQLPPGKYPYLLNLRSDVEGELTVRPGTILSVTVPGPVHSLFRLDNPTPLNQGIPTLRFYGSGVTVYGGAPGNPPFVVDTGYSGNPLVACVAEPVGTIEPYLYVADSARMRKIRTDATVYPCGIDPPGVAPTTSLAQPGLHIFDNFDDYLPNVVVPVTATLPWTAFVGGTSTPPGVYPRLRTTIQTIVYQTGTTGNAVVAFADPTLGVENTALAGMVVLMDTEDVILQELKVAIEPTTVAAALQDTVTGLWSITPLGGLGTGVITTLYSSQVFNLAYFQTYLQQQLEQHGLAADQTGFLPGVPINTYGKGLAAAQAFSAQLLVEAQQNPAYYTTQTTEVTLADLDFPAGCLVQIGTEWTVIQSVAVKQDGTQAFFCALSAPPAIGAPLVGTVAYRVSTVGTHVSGETVLTNVLINTITAAPIQADGSFIPAAGGVQTIIVQTPAGPPSSPGTPPGAMPAGNTPAALVIPDHTATVVAAKAQAIAAGYDLTTACGLAQATILVAQALQAEGAGLFAHFEEFFCPTTPYGPIEPDAIMYPNGQFVYIWGNPCGRTGPGPINVPEWALPATVPDAYNATKYIPVGPITAPLPTVPGSTTPPPPGGAGGAVPPLPLALGQLALTALQPDDRLHCSLWFNGAASASIIKVQILFDVDAVTNNFTQNYYLFEADGASLGDAVQSSPAGAPAPIPTSTLAHQIPVEAVASPITTQLPIGANQWVELTWKVRDMLRVGTDDSRGLANIAAIGVLVTIDSTLGNLEVQYGSLYATGGMNPDAYPAGAPFRYRYGFRSSITGETSNPGPQTRPESLLPLRQQIVLTAPSTPVAAQANLVDWFRIGGALTSETYVGSAALGETFTDNFSDQEIVAGATPVFTRFQLWPTTNQPRSGTCNVSGSIVNWVSGDQFNPLWAPGSQLLIAGLPYTLAAAPPSPTQLSILESAGAGTGVAFVLQAPTLQAQPLPVLFGPFQGLWFGCGDPNNPGALYWTNPDDPDTASDANFLQVTAGNEPLQHGFIRDGAIYVWSTDDLYRIMPTGAPQAPFFVEKTPCGRGLWARWCWDSTPEGEAFLAKDGIFLTAGGSVAKSLTTPDLSNLFPHDGVPGVTINGVGAPDLTQPTQLRLCYIDSYLYFDYAVQP